MSALTDARAWFKDNMWEGRRRWILLLLLLLFLIALILVLRRSDPSTLATRDDKESGELGLDEGGGEILPGEEGGEEVAGPGGGKSSSASSGAARAKKLTSRKRENVGVAKPKTGTTPPGIDYANQIIKVTYYWDDSSSNSAYLEGTGAAQNAVDDGDAFEKIVQFINDNGNGAASLMGSKMNMGNWLIEPSIVLMDRGSDINAEIVRIAQEIKPFAAMSARGSLSTSGCPTIAGAGIHNFATLSYVANLSAATNGYCRPGHISWDQQIAGTVNYMKWHQTTNYTGTVGGCVLGCPRAYGLLYTLYPGLDQQGPVVKSRLEAAGINLVATQSLPAGLSAAAQEAPGIASAFNAAGVNTVIMTDGGASLAFTHAAGNYKPDWYIWPCSGQDTSGYTRLLPAADWDRAAGLSCYSGSFDADLTISPQDRQTQWYAAYKAGAASAGAAESEPPSSTYLVYSALQSVVAGVSNLGNRAFNVENFREGLGEFSPYRYHGINGKTSDANNLLILMGKSSDGSPWGDMARVEWNATPPGVNPFSYIDNRRYKSNEAIP